MKANKHSVVMLFALIFAGCGGGGPRQAEGPKPNLGEEKGGSTTEASTGKPSGGDLAPEIADAQEALKNKDCATATTKAKAALAKGPEGSPSGPSDKDSADAHFVLGVCLEQGGKRDDAWKEYDAALKADPHHLAAAINESALLIDMGKFDEAEAVCKAALAANKGAPELHINLGYALGGKGDHAAAAKSFKNALALEPNDAGLMVDLGKELAASGDKDGASKQFKNALAKTDDAAIIADAGVGLAQVDDAPGCVAALDKAIAKGSSSALLTERAICKHKANDLAGARKDLDDAIAADAKNVKAHAAAAKYAEEAKDKKACKAHWAEVVKMTTGELQAQAKKGEARCSK